jgi:hypothetical protein
MSVSIQGLAVKLTCSTGAFAAGLASATKPVASFASAVAGTSLKVGGLVASLGGLISTGAVVALVKSSIESIGALNDQAAAIGVSAHALGQLQYAAQFAGVGTEALSGGLLKMQRNLAEAATGSGPAADAIKTLGLDAKTLANSSPDQAFKLIADAMSKVENPAQRVQLAMDVFGKSGASLLPVLTQGKNALDEYGVTADRLSVSLSDVNVAQVDAAGDALGNVGQLISGVGNAIAVELSPFISFAADQLVGFAASGDGVGGRVGGAFEYVSKGVAYASDYVSLLQAGFFGFKAGALQAISGVISGVDLLGGGLVSLLNLLPGVNVSWTDTFANLSAGLEQEAAAEAAKFNQALDDFNSGKNSTQVANYFDQIKAKSKAAAEQAVADGPKMGGAFLQLEEDADRSLKKVGDTLANLQKDVSQFGLTDGQKKLADLSAFGADPAQIAQAKQLIDLQGQLGKINSIDTGDASTDFAAKMEELQKLYAAGKVSVDQFSAIRDQAKQTLTGKLTEQAKSVIDSVKSPLDAYNEELTKLQTLLENKLITQQVFDAATAKAKTTLDTATGKTEDITPKVPTVLRSNSAEAQRLAYDSARGIQKQMSKDEVARKTLVEQKNQTKVLESIAKNTKNGATIELEEVGI